MSQESDAKVRVDDKKEGSSEKKLKPCCACPETKKTRDQWQVISGVYLYCEDQAWEPDTSDTRHVGHELSGHIGTGDKG